MEEIVLRRSAKTRKPKRSSVAISPDTYISIYGLAQDAGITVEKLVDTLLKAALANVKVVD